MNHIQNTQYRFYLGYELSCMSFWFGVALATISFLLMLIFSGTDGFLFAKIATILSGLFLMSGTFFLILTYTIGKTRFNTDFSSPLKMQSEYRFLFGKIGKEVYRVTYEMFHKRK